MPAEWARFSARARRWRWPPGLSESRVCAAAQVRCRYEPGRMSAIVSRSAGRAAARRFQGQAMMLTRTCSRRPAPPRQFSAAVRRFGAVPPADAGMITCSARCTGMAHSRLPFGRSLMTLGALERSPSDLRLLHQRTVEPVAADPLVQHQQMVDRRCSPVLQPVAVLDHADGGAPQPHVVQHDILLF